MSFCLLVISRKCVPVAKQSCRYIALQRHEMLAKKPAAAGSKIGTGVSQRIELDVETDPEILTKYLCGGNYLIEGKDPELKADNEYPDWLWQLRTNRVPPDLSEYDPDTWAYWKRARKLTLQRKSRLMKGKKF